MKPGTENERVEAQERFGDLAEEVLKLGNHTRRVLTVTRPFAAALEEASFDSGGVAPLSHDVSSPLEALTFIDEWALKVGENRAALVGAYFAHHGLRAHAKTAKRFLDARLAQHPEQRVVLLREVYGTTRVERTQWIAALLDRAMNLACPNLDREDWVGMNVGSLTDHEDVDLALIARNPQACAEIARGFGLVSRTFVRFASKIQLFLSEHLASGAVAGGLEEYRALLDQPRSIVVVMQLLHAEHLAGANELFGRFSEDVVRRFRPTAKEKLVHEGLLRSLLAELLSMPMNDEAETDQAEVVSPKREIYIPAKLATAALRGMFDVHDPQPAESLRQIAVRHPEGAEVYRRLADAFEENEVLRALIFSYVVPEDRIDLRDRAVRDATVGIGRLLGIEASPSRSPEARILGLYREVRTRARESLREITIEIRAHVARISSLRQMLERGSELARTGANVATRFVAALKRFRGAVFWDELVELSVPGPTPDVRPSVPLGEVRVSERPSTDLFRRFVGDLEAMDEGDRAPLLFELARMMAVEPGSALEFLAYVAREAGAGSSIPAGVVLALDRAIGADSGLRERFAVKLSEESSGSALYRLVCASPPEVIGALARTVETPNASGETSASARRAAQAMRAALVLAQRHSNHIGRTIARAVERSPELFRFLSDPSRLVTLETQIAASASKEGAPKAQISKLGDSFDISVIRAVLGAILGGSPVEQDASLIQAFEAYTRELFKAAFREVHARSPMFAPYRPGVGVALFATGGFGRGHAFGADWDYFALVDERDEAQRKFVGKIVQLVEGELARRGVMPHNRLSDTFRAYAVTVPELVTYLRRRTLETFVDEAEILESRFILGDRTLKRRFESEVVARVITENGAAFIRDVANEIRGRRSEVLPALDLKLTPGGLRDIHLVGLAAAVFSGKTPGQTLPATVSFPEGPQRDLRFLNVAEAELRRMRDLYRLLVASEDYIDLAALPRLEHELPSLAQSSDGHELEKLLAASRERIDRLLAFLLDGRSR